MPTSGRARGRAGYRPGSRRYWFALVTRPARHCVRSARVNTRTRSPRFETRARRDRLPPSRNATANARRVPVSRNECLRIARSETVYRHLS